MSNEDELELQKWSVKPTGIGVLETSVVPITEEQEDKFRADPPDLFRLSLAVNNQPTEGAARLAIVGHLSTLADPFYMLRTSCLVPIVDFESTVSGLDTPEKRDEALVRYAGLVEDLVWDFCRHLALTAAASAEVEVNLPAVTPTPAK